MSGNADTIKDFLVSLGFDIDQAGANKFEAVLKGVTANVLKVGAVVEGAALSIVGFTTQIANGLDKIYWASQRTVSANVNSFFSAGAAVLEAEAAVLLALEAQPARIPTAPRPRAPLTKLLREIFSMMCSPCSFSSFPSV